MKNRRIALFLALLAVAQALTGTAFAKTSIPQESPMQASVEENLDAYTDNQILAFYQDGSYQIYSFNSRKELSEGLKTLAADPSVTLVQPNYAYSGQAVSTNDALVGSQWALSNDGSFQLQNQQTRYAVIDTPNIRHFGRWSPSNGGSAKAASILTGTGGTAAAGIDINAQTAWNLFDGGKRDVIVAMIDTGIDYTHEDLAGAIWVNQGEIPGNGIDDDGNGYVDDVYGWNFYDNNNQVYSGTEDSHGTHGAGTIAASSDNGMGIAGIVPGNRVKVMSVKALGGSEGSGTTASLIQAIRYAEANGASICNLSLSSSKDDRALYQAMANSNMLFVVAAGNDSSNNDSTPTYPASYDLDNILTVANLHYDGNLHATSNYGASSVDLAAPGSSILSTTPGNTYSYMTGTSMAAPMVSAAAAMVYSYFENATLADVKDILLASAKPLESLAGLVASGGMLDIGAALSYDVSNLSGRTWTLPQSSAGSAPVIEARLTTQNGNAYLAIQVTDSDGDLQTTAYAPGEFPASAFAGGTAGTTFSLDAQGIANFTATHPGTYTFYARDKAGNETVKTVVLSF